MRRKSFFTMFGDKCLEHGATACEGRTDTCARQACRRWKALKGARLPCLVLAQLPARATDGPPREALRANRIPTFFTSPEMGGGPLRHATNCAESAVVKNEAMGRRGDIRAWNGGAVDGLAAAKMINKRWSPYLVDAGWPSQSSGTAHNAAGTGPAEATGLQKRSSLCTTFARTSGNDCRHAHGPWDCAARICPWGRLVCRTGEDGPNNFDSSARFARPRSGLREA